MSGAARIASVEILKFLRSELCKLAVGVSSALGEAESEVQRTLLWLRQDRQHYWKGEFRVRTERLAAARLALKEKEVLDLTPLKGNYSYIDEKKAVAAAQRRCEEAERKIQHIRQGVVLLEREAILFKGQTQRLGSVIEVEVPNALAWIDRMIEALEAYMALAPPEGMVAVEGLAEVFSVVEAPRIPVQKSVEPEKSLINAPALRSRTPDRQARQGFPWGQEVPEWVENIVGPLDAQPAERIMEGTGAIDEHDHIVIADMAAVPGSFYLECLEKSSPDDFGWYIGPADETVVTGHVVLTAAKVQAARPDLALWLNLAPGSLVLWTRGQMQDAINRNDQSLAPAKETP